MGARGNAPARGNSGSGGGTVNRVPATAPATEGIARSQFQQRAQGATAGVTRSGGQPVFASPAAKAKKAKAAPAGSRADTLSARTASGDLWTGFRPQSRSSVFAAEAAGGTSGGGGALTAALAILGLGLAGAVGSASVLGLRRRRAGVKASGDTTK